MTIAAHGSQHGNGAVGAGPSGERTLDRCALAAKAASDKLGQDIVVLNIEQLLGLTDAFVITSGANARQVRTIIDEIERQLKLAGSGGPISLEGLDDARWALMDYGDFVVHVFLDEAREFYDLEHLWGDAPAFSWDERSGKLVGASSGT